MPSTALRDSTIAPDCVSSFVVAGLGLAEGVSATGLTVSTNVSDIVCGVPATVAFTVSVIVVEPN